MDQENVKARIQHEMTKAVNVYKYFRYVYYVEAGELIYADTDNAHYKEWIRWIRKK